ncbi:excinuclease ABC subunit UvrA [Candidatus Calescamantes bacterium]|nr:excinuclease ABC subunit UvrA [Candidatus Calescamantes bacterium]
MSLEKIVIRGAKEHNLKNINLEIPRNKLVVITGLSGSGKSSLAFDTIYAEGQRRYVESLSAYARQFLEQMEKPDVDYIEGLSPAIAIEQKAPPRNPRSTVGTVTEIYDYLRILFASIGKVYCYRCGRRIEKQSAEQIVDHILSFPEGTKLQILAPVVRGRKGEYQKLLEEIRRQGFVRVRIDGEIYDLDEEIRLEKYKRHDIDVVVDRVKVSREGRTRITEGVELALKIAEGLVKVILKEEKGEKEILFSEKFACPDCGISYGELSPRMFSFNSPYGACPACSGLGEKMEIDPRLVVPDDSLSIAEGALEPWANPITTRRHRWKWSTARYYRQILECVARHYGFSLHTPFRELPEEIKTILLYGSDEEIEFEIERGGEVYHYWDTFEGVIRNLERRYNETDSEYVREEIFKRYIRMIPCPECKGKRLRKESLSVEVGGKNIAEITAMSIKEALNFFQNLKLTSKEELIAGQVIKEICARLKFLVDVGLDYLTLDRKAETLSGGEAERIRLATQIGSKLVGVLYILDEPTIGLHQRDNARLLNTLKSLRDLGNTVIVVEHDENTIRNADFIIDLGPGAGEHGGEVVVAGTLEDVINCPHSLTGKYLSGELSIPIPSRRRKHSGKYLEIRGAREHNLKNITVRIPLGLFVCITGVSGSGKSTLVEEILYRALAKKLYKSRVEPGEHDEIVGWENIDKVIHITQEPIGRTPRSNPATYTDTFTHIRQLFAQTPEARMRGYKPGRFSFNVKGGRCEVCQGEGLIKIEMHFLPDVYITCDACKGKRYNRETLEVKYRGKSIADVLDMSVEEALKFFSNIPVLKRKLQTLYDVGLGYIKLGQPATTLSGGEAQRVKLAKELSKVATGNTLYILDEPTTGLHFADVEKLLNVLNRLVDKGNTVVIIEHNLDVIKSADYIIDLGPEGGEEGGWIVAEGTPEEVAENPRSYTGQFLRKVLHREGVVVK